MFFCAGVVEMLRDPDSRPHLLLACRQFNVMLDDEQLLTSQDAEEPHERRHYSANVDAVTLFTKPLTKCVRVTLCTRFYCVCVKYSNVHLCVLFCILI